MRWSIKISVSIFFVLQSACTFSQDIHFDKLSLSGSHRVQGIAQDSQGYIWILTADGLYQYDGSALKRIPNQPDSSSQNDLTALSIDSTGMIWMGTWGTGVQKFDPFTNKFAAFKHDPLDPYSLANDTIIRIMTDHANNIWVGTYNGLDKLDRSTGKFSHFEMDKTGTSTGSSNRILSVYEDRQNIVWAGYGTVVNYFSEKKSGGLERLEPVTGKFTRFPASDEKFVNDGVSSIFEDSKQNLWLGMQRNGLQMLDKKPGRFIHFPFDWGMPKNEEGALSDLVTFITEDKMGYIWAGSYEHGISRFNLSLNTKTHYGSIVDNAYTAPITEDSVSGFDRRDAISSFCSMDGTFWVGTAEGDVYKAGMPRAGIPYFNLQSGANSFYQQNDSILWIGTSTKGLGRRNLNTGKDTWITNKNGNPDIPPDHDILALRSDGYSNLWVGTFTGLYKLNLSTNVFTRYTHNDKNSNTPSHDSIQCMHVDKKALWIGTYGYGLDKLNLASGNYEHYTHNKNDSNSISNSVINCITENKNNDVWVGTLGGLNKLDHATNKFSHYLKKQEILCICVDSRNGVWVGTTDGLYYLESDKIGFREYTNENSPTRIFNVLHILEDDQQNLWLSTSYAIIKIDTHNNTVNVFGKNYGVHYNDYYDCDNYKLANGQLLFGDENGYYLATPAALQMHGTIFLNFTDFKINNKKINTEPGSAFSGPIWQEKEIRLTYNQNSFSFDFNGTDYGNTGGMKYFYMLENYNNNWSEGSTEHKVYFFSVPAGKYVLRIKAINEEGMWAEKSISIVISPPWWRTWWAYSMFVLLFVGATMSFIRYRSARLRRENKILEDKVNHRTEQLRKSLEELKSAQAQLVQSEKMASLGELTAGIAHEIQNPLNFVNNFSDVNKELLNEMKEEMMNGRQEQANAIANDIIENEEKINHHGKRADAIVKGMLQHSRASTGQREPTDINALCDEYLRLAYHGLRARDKNFNAAFETDFDDSMGKVNLVSQDIGRVLLNLINNAFYAVAAKTRSAAGNYKPLVTVATKKLKDKIEIRVTDNGDGIPQKVVDKIFQPFFTTKPTGQGTGLGLSLAYDIVKAHGGEIKVETKEGEGTIFTIQLPISRA